MRTERTYHSAKPEYGHSQGMFFQPKLTINNPNDQYEKEADEVADHVMRKDNADAFFKPLPIQRQVIQRQEPDEEKPVSPDLTLHELPTWKSFTQTPLGEQRYLTLDPTLFPPQSSDTPGVDFMTVNNIYLNRLIPVRSYFDPTTISDFYSSQYSLYHGALGDFKLPLIGNVAKFLTDKAVNSHVDLALRRDGFLNYEEKLERGGMGMPAPIMFNKEFQVDFKLAGNNPDTPKEREANEVAEKILYDTNINKHAGLTDLLNISQIRRKCTACEKEENIQRKILAEDVSAVVPVNMMPGGLNLIQRQENTRIDDTEIIHTEEEFSAVLEDDSLVAENDLEIQFPGYEIPVDDWRHQAILNYFRRGVQRLLQAIGNGLLWNWERWRGTDQITELRAGNVIVRTREERNEILRNYIQESNEWISFYEDLPIAFPYMGWDVTPEHDFTSESYNPSASTETITLAWICSELLESHQIRNGSTILEATLLFSYLYHRPSFSFAPGETPRSYATGRELLIRQINEHTVAARYLSSAPIRDDEIILPENRDSNGRFFTWDGFRVYDNSEGWQDAYRGIEIATIMRKSMGNDNEELQRMSANGNEIQANGEIEKYVGNLNAGGSSLSPETNQFFSQKIGYDFSNVKIHTDNVAAKSAQSINALAYTTGNNIVFNQNQYQPNTDAGKKLLAHELTHVVQQNAFLQQKKVQRKRELTGEEAKKCLEKAETTTKALEDSLISRGEELPEYIKGAVKNLRSKLIEGKVKCYYFDGIVHGSVDYTKDEIQIDGGNLELINETILLHEAVHHYHGKQFPKAAKEYGENVGKEIDPNTTKGLNLLKWKAWTEYWAYRSGSDYYNPTCKQPMTDEEIHESVMRIDAVAKAVRNVWRYDNKFDVRKWKPVG